MGVNAGVEDIIADIKKKCKDGKYIFRGTNEVHSGDSDGISSSLYREYKKFGLGERFFQLKNEEYTLGRARKHFPGGTNDIEILTDIRHYGGNSTMIDFTTNLYVALFFACYGEPEAEGEHGEREADGELVLLNRNKDSVRPSTKEDADHENRESLIIKEPAHTQSSRARVIAQHSIFVYAPQGYIKKDDHETHLIEVVQKQKILAYLEKFHNIHANSVYNDLLGFIDIEKEYERAKLYFYKGNEQMAEGNKQMAESNQ